MDGTEQPGARSGLHPDAASYLKRAADWLAASGLPPLPQMDPDLLRRALRAEVRATRPPLIGAVQATDIRIPGRSGRLRMRVLRPPVAGPLPALLYLHAGGYVVGGVEESEHEARRIALATPAVVFSLDYRLAPEAPFPAAVEDGWDALAWLAHHAADQGGDPARLLLAGTSAGGGLAAAVARLAATHGGPRVASLFLLCPWLDLTLSQPSVATYGEGFGLDREELDWYAGAYLSGGTRAEDPLVSPALHPAPPGMPPTFVIAAECDPLRDEAFLFADRLTASGARVLRLRADGMVHAFNLLGHFIPAAARPIGLIDRALRGAADDAPTG